MKRIFLRFAFLLGRKVAKFSRKRQERSRRKLEAQESTNGALPAFVFSGCVTLGRAPDPVSIAFDSQEATIADVIDILERGTPKRRRRKKA
jgi:hypothetical protein